MLLSVTASLGLSGISHAPAFFLSSFSVFHLLSSLSSPSSVFTASVAISLECNPRQVPDRFSLHPPWTSLANPLVRTANPALIYHITEENF